MKLDVRHVFPCSADQFWAMFWDDDFDRYLQEGAAVNRTILSERKEGDVHHWRMRFEPDRELNKSIHIAIQSVTDGIETLRFNTPVSRMMVRQPQSKANAGAWTNGMPMTSSLGCGIWGGNITNENVTMKHMMNYTWVSRPIPEDRPSEEELFGEFFGADVA